MQRTSRCYGHLAAALILCLQTVYAAGQSSSLPADVQDAACSLPGLGANAVQAPTEDDLLRAYNAQSALIYSLRGTLILHIRKTGEQVDRSKPMPATLSFRAPASVRFTGTAPFSGRQTFDLVSDGREFELMVPNRNTMSFIAGPVNGPAAATYGQENLRPQAILEAIRGIPARLRGTAAQRTGTTTAQQKLNVDLTTASGQTVEAQLTFDLHSGTLAQLTISDAGGSSVTKVDYTDWRRIPDDRQEGKFVCFPTRIYVTQPQQSQQLELKFLSIEMNAPVLPSLFHFFPPPGVSEMPAGENSSKGTPKP